MTSTYDNLGKLGLVVKLEMRDAEIAKLREEIAALRAELGRKDEEIAELRESLRLAMIDRQEGEW